MSFAPQELVDLDAYWEAHGGKGLGIVGGAGHTVGYHLGKDRIYDGSGPGIGDNDYSVKHERDIAGLTNAASAIDLGRLDGTYKALRTFSKWLVAQCQKDAAFRRDIREIIYSPDGATVQRYSGIDNKIHSGPGNGDDTHLTHTHISFFRDSQKRDKTYLFRPYFEEPDMGIAVNLATTKDTNPYDALGTATLRSGALQRVRDSAGVNLAAGTDLGVVQLGTRVSDGAPIVALNHAGELHIAPLANVTFDMLTPPPIPPDTTPYDKDDLDAAHADGVTVGTTAEKERIAAAEADRIRAL